MNGWVKLHRKILENSFLTHDVNAFAVFVKLLLKANSKGEWSGGRRQLGEIVDLNDRTLYDVLKRLENQQLINIKPNRKYSVISICKWSKYQSLSNRTSNHSPTTAQPQPNTLIRIENKNKEGLKDRREKYGKGYSTFQQVGTLIKQKEIKVNK